MENFVLAKVRQEKEIVASSGIDVNSLPGVRTAHVAFMLPFNLTSNDEPVNNIIKSSLPQILMKCSSIIRYKVAISHKKNQ